MRPGDQLRFRGPAGAEFVVTVGVAWDEKTIRARVESGEWTALDDEPKAKAPARPRKRAAKKTAAPKAAAPKADADAPKADG